MKIKIQSLKFDADIKLLEFIEAKIEKLEQYHDKIISVEVTLRLDKAEDMSNKVVDIKILVPENEIYSKRQAKSFEEAVSEAILALEKQIQKIKSKLH